MTLEVGKTYLPREGPSVTILRPDNRELKYPFLGRNADGIYGVYTVEGRYYAGSESRRDLVQEVPEPPLSIADGYAGRPVITGETIRRKGDTSQHLITDTYPECVIAGRAGTEITYDQLAADYEVRTSTGGWVTPVKP